MKRRDRSHVLPVFAFLLQVCLLAASCAARAVTRYSLGPSMAAGGKAEFSSAGFVLSAEPLAGEAVRERLRKTGWAVPPAGEGFPLLGFLLRAENRGKGEVLLDPRMALLMDAKGQRTFPCDTSCLYQLFRSEEASRRVMAGDTMTSIDQSLTLSAGGKAEHLIVLVRPRELPEGHVVLVLSGIYAAGEPLEATFMFPVIPEGR